jgi:hypothetical protein
MASTQAAVQALFGDSSSDSDSDSDDDILAELENSDSDSDSSSSDDEPAPKKRKKASKPAAPKKKPAPAASRKPSHVGSGDEYDSEKEVHATAADRAFIDSDDDQDELAKEYAKEQQRFKDRRPDRRTAQKKHATTFDAILAENKPKRYKTRKDAQVVQREVDEFVYKMREMAKGDQKAVEQKKHATYKLKFLEDAMVQLQKRKLQDNFLDAGALVAINEWLFPYHDYTLTNLTVRTEMLNLLTLFHGIEKKHLKVGRIFNGDRPEHQECGIAKTLVMLSRHNRETGGNKKIIRTLLEKWQRKIFSKSDNYSHMQKMRSLAKKNNQQYNDFRRGADEGVETITEADEEMEGLIPGYSRSVPAQLSFNYHRNVKSKRADNGESARRDNASQAGLSEKVKSKILARRKEKSSKGSKRAVNMSIEGRGMRK